MDPNGRVLKQLGPGKLDGTKDKVWIDFPFKDLREVTDPKEAPELKLRVSSTGATYITYPSRNPDSIESALIKSVRDESGNIVTELLYARAFVAFPLLLKNNSDYLKVPWSQVARAT